MSSTQISSLQTHTQQHLNWGVGMLLALLVMLIALMVIGGCQKTALRPDDHRSQYDRYDRSRNQRAEPFLEDEYGRRTPNLSERLLDRGG